jgi:uncharacterized membrane protein
MLLFSFSFFVQRVLTDASFSYSFYFLISLGLNFYLYRLLAILAINILEEKKEPTTTTIIFIA